MQEWVLEAWSGHTEKPFLASRSGVWGLGMTQATDSGDDFLGTTKLSLKAVNYVLNDIADEYPGSCYDVFRCNCRHRADICECFGVLPLPDWVYRLARKGAWGGDSVKPYFREESSCRFQDHLPSSLTSLLRGKGSSCAPHEENPRQLGTRGIPLSMVQFLWIPPRCSDLYTQTP